MAFTRVLGPGIHTEADVSIHNLESTGIITTTELNVTGNVSIAGSLTYDDVTNVDSVGVITARSGIQGIGIQSSGLNVAVGVLTALNFVGAGNTFKLSGNTIDISISGTSGQNRHIFPQPVVGVGTTGLNDEDLQGVGVGSARGLYVSNGMILNDNSLNGDHYIGTSFNGMMAGPVNVEGVLTVDGNYVVL
tara:strand:- start:1189 stop:1761 length:573 start_codon:yes stop_codon:yes gene_type:complete